jgi:rubrerythrin
MDLVWFVLIVMLVGAFGMLAGAGRSRDDLRWRRRWDSAFYSESHRQTRTDATEMLMCRRCGASASERAGRCPSCGAVL